MALGNSDPSNSFSARTTTPNPPVALHTGPRFADFQFRIIGQQPELLKRISVQDPDTQYDHDHDRLSPSSLWPDRSTKSPPLPESDSAKRPSLQDRLSLLESPATERVETVDVTMEDALEIRPVVDTRSTQTISVLPMATSTTQAFRYTDSSASEGPPTISRTHFLQNRNLREEPDLSQDMIYTAKQDHAIRATTEQGATSASDESRFPLIMSSSETQSRLSSPFVQSLTQATGATGSPTPFSFGEDVHSLTALRTLQSRLSSSLSTFNPISTANALAAAQSAKDQCTQILATAHRAHTLARQASSLAHDSMLAAQDCLNVAATVQNRADLALSAVERIRSGQGTGSSGEWEYNATIKALKDDLCDLDEWVRQRAAYESKHLRQLEEYNIKKSKNKSTPQLDRESQEFSANKQSHDIITRSKFSGVQTSIHEASAITVEDEADAATRAWNQHREQSAERKRLAEDELRKRREAEVELERQRLEAQAEVDAREAELERLRAERLKAEEDEKSRQEKETLELQRRQQELEIARFLRSQKKAQDDLANFAAEEKKKAQAAEAEKEARLITEHEQKRRELHEKEVLKRQEIEKAKALLAEAEAKRREKANLERTKRLAVEAQQLPASIDTVADILDKAKEKQFTANLATDNHTPPSQHAPLPTRQASVSSSPNHAEFGNVVSKKTLLTNSPQSSKQQNRILSGNIRVDESSNSVRLTSSIPSFPTMLGTKSQVTPSILPPIDKLPSDNPTIGTSSSHIQEVDRNSVNGVCNTDPLKSHPSPSSLTPLNEGSSSLPVSMPAVHTSNSPATRSNDLEDIHAEIDNHSGAGNVYVVPLSRVVPVSAEAQRANLRPFMDANGISYGPGASGVDEQKTFSSNVEKSCRMPLSSSQMSGDQIRRTSAASKPESTKKPKLECLDDVPILSMPSPAAATIDIAPPCATLPAKPKSSRVPSMTTLEIPLSSKDLTASPQTTPPSGLIAQLEGSSLTTPPIVSKEKVRPAAVRRNVPPLTSNEQPPTPADTIIQTSDRHLSVSPRMGPDAAVNDGWAQPVTMVDDQIAKGPRKQLPRKGLDRLSPPRRVPSVTSQNRLPPIRPRARVNDHYSPPRRIPDPLPSSHNDYSRDRRYSPQPQYNEDHRSLSPEDMPVLGRKRYRDDDSVVAPPSRRYRYDSPPVRQDDHVQPPTSSYQQHDGDWNRVATYARSPSPESRPTPLALRLDSEKPSRNSQGGSSYRPIYSNSTSYAYDPQSRNNQNHRYSAPHSQPIPQGPSYHGDASAQSNQQRQFIRNDSMNDTHLPLLSRFTDSAEQTLPPFNSHHGPTRPRMPRGRGGGNHTLEHRISKSKTVSLINRLEDAN
ncbi:hypothetical protein BYT27DRAFT_7239200 [Phlegmacium glaucopus]|nr:hypothetical protein BYT27DRAFT_7239200 [Phlegmacium glaucopus]